VEAAGAFFVEWLGRFQNFWLGTEAMNREVDVTQEGRGWLVCVGGDFRTWRACFGSDKRRPLTYINPVTCHSAGYDVSRLLLHQGHGCDGSGLWHVGSGGGQQAQEEAEADAAGGGGALGALSFGEKGFHEKL
jgi:hypothetical protein